MNDMIVPGNEVNFTFEEIYHKREMVGIFFNCLCNLNKFIAYETRDLFSIKHQVNENPEFTEWDWFAKQEYERLAMEEENPEDSDVIDGMDGVDGGDSDEADTQASETKNINAG